MRACVRASEGVERSVVNVRGNLERDSRTCAGQCRVVNKLRLVYHRLTYMRRLARLFLFQYGCFGGVRPYRLFFAFYLRTKYVTVFNIK